MSRHAGHRAEILGRAQWPGQQRPDGKTEAKHACWDFVFERADNTSCWLHPNCKGNNVEYGECVDNAVAPDGSELAGYGGLGGSWGSGTYKYYRNARKDDDLKLDKNKNVIKKEREETG
mgnify:CR=1 FL=1